MTARAGDLIIGPGPLPRGFAVDEFDEDVDGFARYEEILQEVLSGRVEGHKCPFCIEGDLECSADDMKVRVRCLKCGRFFEGSLA